MISKNLICPACRNQFEFALDEEVFSGNVLCPRCEVNLAYTEYKEMIFCPVCRAAAELSLSHPEDEIPKCAQCSAELFSAVPEKSPFLRDGDFFDKYRIITRVGKGGMSEVYKAEHLLLKQIYALKILKNDRSQEYPLMYKRFLREGKCFHQIDHPNIVRVYDIGCDVKTGHLFIAMEYLDGGTLAELCTTPMPETELLRVAEDIAHALAELEKQQIIHRDIKPSNIMLTSDGKYKLMDLGIAKTVNADNSDYTLTVDQAIFGTPVYASPEQCESPHDVDCRSDIYSLGATLYHLACGEPPFDGKSPLSIVVNVVGNSPLPLRDRMPELSAGTVNLIERMMDKSPQNRPQNANVLLDELAMLKGGCPRKNYRRRQMYWSVTLLLILLAASGILLPQKQKAAPLHTEEKTPLIARNLKLFCDTLPETPNVTNWRNPPAFDWHIHLSQALREAKEKNLNVLLLLHREHIMPKKWRDEKFLRALRKKYVLMFGECSDNGMPEEQQQHIEQLCNILQINDAAPAAAVISPDGEFIRLYKNINAAADGLFSSTAKLKPEKRQRQQ